MAPTTLAELESQYKFATTQAANFTTLLKNLVAQVNAGQIHPQHAAPTMFQLKAEIERWTNEANRLQDAIATLTGAEEEPPTPEDKAKYIQIYLAEMTRLDADAREGLLTFDAYTRQWNAIAANLKAYGYDVTTLTPLTRAEIPEPKPEPTVDELEELKAEAEAACNEARAWAAHEHRSRAQSDAACDAAYKAIMDGKTRIQAAQAAMNAALALAAEDPIFDVSGLISAFGRLGALKDDAVVGSEVAGAVGGFLATLGLTPGALEELKASPLDRDKAAQVATGISIAAQTGLGLIYSIGVFAEVASLGQIESVTDMIDNILRNLGIDEIIKPLFTAPFYAALTIPVRQYWMKVYRPTIPPIQDLRVMAVREAFPVETREEQFDEMERWGGYHGLDEYWRDAYLKAGYERMDVRTALDMFYWRLWDEGQLKAFLSIADIHPDDHNAIISTLWRSPTRYERRHGYIMGVYDDAALEEYFHRDGLSDEDSKTATMAMTAYALNAERNAVARAAGRVYRETLEGVLEGIRDRDKEVRDAMAALEEAKAALRAAVEGVTQATVDRAEEDLERAKSALGGLKRRAAGIREEAEAELRGELTDLKLTGERQDLWVRRYAMEARVTTRPWELIEGEEAEVPYEPEG